ncbi:hypothetical protein [Mucilaginibacter sp. UYCu711]|uniref:hypothetical protein n=1 Tax=Mucilaginibacter sp. UYCu711 TaxID=3156339 RepID=UPI003D1C6E63
MKLNRLVRIWLLMSGIILLCGCVDPFGMAIDKQVVGKFYLTAPDTGEQTALSYQGSSGSSYSVIVCEKVIAIGYNDQYIIAEQERGKINYFIVPINNKNKVKGHWFGEIGPLTLNEFNAEKKALGLEKVKFTIFYKDLD